MSAPVVFWDFDGTLAERPGMWSACLVECLVEVSGGTVDVRRDDLRPFLRTGFPWHQPHRGHEHLDADAWWAELEVIFTNALRGVQVAPAVARRAASLMRHRFTAADKWTLFPEAIPSLEALVRAGWRNAILSNHVPELYRLVGELGLGDYVDSVFTSATIGWEKPNPKFFRHAVAAMGRPPHAWMVGDNPIADIRGAEAVGIPAILVHAEPGAQSTPSGLRQATERILAASGG
jgi:putative hydrolase of the HAD superfamily